MISVTVSGPACDLHAFRLQQNPHIAMNAMCGAPGILAARKLAQFDSFRRVPVTLCIIADAVRWAEEIMRDIDHRWPQNEKGR